MSDRVPAMMTGGALDLRGTRTGRVLAVFDQAINLVIDAEMWTIFADPRRMSPYSICLAGPDWRRIAVTAGATATVHGGLLMIGGRGIDCRDAPRWSPSLWPCPAGGLAQRLRFVMERARARAWEGTETLLTRLLDELDNGTEAIADQTLARIMGRGPGLTPSGDDLIVGVFGALHLSPCIRDGAAQARRLTEAMLPLLPTTPDISRQLLAQAAAGHVSRPLHDLGRALHAPGNPDRLSAALDLALDVGATSGADACLGLAGLIARRLAHPEKAAA
jgi:hypothetical protein